MKERRQREKAHAMMRGIPRLNSRLKEEVNPRSTGMFLIINRIIKVEKKVDKKVPDAMRELLRNEERKREYEER